MAKTNGNTTNPTLYEINYAHFKIICTNASGNDEETRRVLKELQDEVKMVTYRSIAKV
jgi:hypothetical protein